MAKSRIQMNQARGFRSKASDGVDLALNVLPLDIVFVWLGGAYDNG